MYSIFNAIAAGDSAAVQRLLADDSSRARAMKDGASALMIAIYAGKHEIAQLIAQAATPLTLHEAAMMGDVARIQSLAHAAADAVHAYSDDGWTALHLAAGFGQLASCRALLAAKADVNAWSKNALANQPI